MRWDDITLMILAACGCLTLLVTQVGDLLTRVPQLIRAWRQVGQAWRDSGNPAAPSAPVSDNEPSPTAAGPVRVAELPAERSTPDPPGAPGL